jgi:hypothetical protein
MIAAAMVSATMMSSTMATAAMTSLGLGRGGEQQAGRNRHRDQESLEMAHRPLRAWCFERGILAVGRGRMTVRP